MRGYLENGQCGKPLDGDGVPGPCWELVQMGLLPCPRTPLPFWPLGLASYPAFTLHTDMGAGVGWPAPRDKNFIARLRAARTFPALTSQTKRCQSFINFVILHYQ